MPQLGGLLAQFHPPSGVSESQRETPALPEFLQRVRKLTGLRKDYVYSNLRVPDQSQKAKDDISIVILAGHGIFCIDVKPWRGTVSAHNQNWHVRVKEEDQKVSGGACIEQMEDPLKAIKTKAENLCGHLKRSGVSVRRGLFVPRVVFPSPDCELSEELSETGELLAQGQIDDFLASFRGGGYVAWVSDALTPSWLSGHLSYGQMESARQVLAKVGTWDVVRLHRGPQLRGDYQSCQYIAPNRQETDTLEFSRGHALSADSLWALLGHPPQVTVKMYRRGPQGWLGKSPNATATIPSDACVLFRVSGEETDARIPANAIHSITLSM